MEGGWLFGPELCTYRLALRRGLKGVPRKAPFGIIFILELCLGLYRAPVEDDSLVTGALIFIFALNPKPYTVIIPPTVGALIISLGFPLKGSEKNIGASIGLL